MLLCPHRVGCLLNSINRDQISHKRSVKGKLKLHKPHRICDIVLLLFYCVQSCYT